MLKKIAISAVAATGFAMTPAALAMTGVFVDGNLGYANQATESEIDFTGDTFDKRTQHHFAWGAAFGYNYDTSEQLGLGGELGYADYNQVEYKDAAGNKLENKQTAWFLLGDATWHINPMFDLIGKAGFAYGKSDGNVTGSYASASQTNHLYRPMVSVGAGWNITEELNLHANWDHIFGSKITADDIVDSATGGGKIDKFQTVDAFWLGLKYTFKV